MIHDPVLAHELRTPLHGVLAAAALLLDSALTAEQREHADTIREAAGALLRIANESLGGGVTDPDEPSACDPRSVAEGVRRLLDAPARAKGLVLDVECDGDAPVRALGRPGWLRQVLVNLVGNAVKFTEVGDVIVRVRRVGNDVRFEVRDSGPGLDAATQAVVFRPRTHTVPHTGAGLGLSISAALVARMGGAMGVRSALGEGSTFWCTLPGSDTPLPAVTPPAAPSLETRADAARRQKSLLLLDDDAVGRRVTARMLERLGWRVDVVGRVGDAEEALRRARYDAVLLDCELPDGDGTGVARWLRRGECAGARTRVVALTASPDAATHARCLEAGMDACLVKPAGFDELAAVLAGPAPEAGPTGACDAVLDMTRVEALAELETDSPGLLARIAADYAAGAMRQLRLLEDAVASGNPSAAARAAHAVRGSSATAGAARAAALAAGIELAASRVAELPPGDARRLAAASSATASVDALYAAVIAAAEALERRANAVVPAR